MAFGRNKKAKLPTRARVAKRERRGGGTDTGYYLDGSFYLLDGTLANSSDYTTNYEYVPESQVASTLSDAGYDVSSASTSGYASGGYVASDSSPSPSPSPDTGSYTSSSDSSY